MINLAQSSFLQALGLAIANSLWQSAILWLITYLAITIARPKAGKQYILAVAASLLSLCWFVFSIVHFYWQLNATGTENSFNAQSSIALSAGSLWLKNVQIYLPYLSALYLMVAIVLAIRLLVGFREVKMLRTTQLQKAPVAWRIFVKKYAAILQIEKGVEVWLSAKVKSPLTIGFWKPIILLPLAGINHLSPQQVEAVLLHELSHIRRFDYLINIALQATEILMFFNPFVRLLLKKAYQEREISCDDWVLQFNYDGAEYARALLSIEQTEHASILALGVNNSHKHYLLNRIARIIRRETKPTDYGKQLSTLAMVMLTLLMMNSFDKSISTKQRPTTKAAYSSSDFFSPFTQMNRKIFTEMEAAAQAFSMARNAGMQLATTTMGRTNELPYNKEAVINMVTEEEALAIEEVNTPPNAFYQLHEVMPSPILYEVRADEFMANKDALVAALQSENLLALNAQIAKAEQAIQQAQNILEAEGKTHQAALQNLQQKIKDYEVEIQALIATIPAEYRKQLMNAKFDAEYLPQEILKATIADKYIIDRVAEKQYSFSYNTSSAMPHEKASSGQNANSVGTGTVSKLPDHTFVVSKKSIVRSKDNDHFTITLGNAEKEISICLPAASNIATLNTMKQLEAAGVLVIDNKTALQKKAAKAKKPRVIVSF